MGDAFCPIDDPMLQVISDFRADCVAEVDCPCCTECCQDTSDVCISNASQISPTEDSGNGGVGTGNDNTAGATSSSNNGLNLPYEVVGVAPGTEHAVDVRQAGEG